MKEPNFAELFARHAFSVFAAQKAGDGVCGSSTLGGPHVRSNGGERHVEDLSGLGVGKDALVAESSQEGQRQ